MWQQLADRNVTDKETDSLQKWPNKRFKSTLKSNDYFITNFSFLIRVHKDATAASVISDVAAALGLDPGRMYVLAEVKESGGEEWVLEPGDLPAQRFLLWPRKAQEQHPQSLGFYFLLQVNW